jgi:hypothetical protein
MANAYFGAKEIDIGRKLTAASVEPRLDSWMQWSY